MCIQVKSFPNSNSGTVEPDATGGGTQVLALCNGLTFAHGLTIDPGRAMTTLAFNQASDTDQIGRRLAGLASQLSVATRARDAAAFGAGVKKCAKARLGGGNCLSPLS